ncbi:hypothetical protein [Luteimonas sp. gir]|uniref:hypothetical protein n=1 Tax=Luteimonas sp. gir TaxID=3127960 RepID=UPI003075BDA1
MRLTENELKHVMNVDWGLRFWHWFRWVLALVLLVLAIGGQLGLSRPIAIEWLVIGGVYVLVAWPGLCRAYVYHALRRLIDEDEEARDQLREAMSRRR